MMNRNSIIEIFFYPVLRPFGTKNDILRSVRYVNGVKETAKNNQ